MTNCPECGIEFNSTHKFCSGKCGRNYRKRTGFSHKCKMIELNCELCGKKVYINRTQQKNGRRFCSRKCADYGSHIGKKKIGVLCDFMCKGCGKGFKAQRSRLHKFCSRRCYTKFVNNCWRENVTILHCDSCGIQFVRDKSHHTRDIKRMQKHFYCSKHCQHRGRKKYGNN